MKPAPKNGHPRLWTMILTILITLSGVANAGENPNTSVLPGNEPNTISPAPTTTVGVIRLHGQITEGPGVTAWSMMGIPNSDLTELTDRLAQAGGDPKLNGILLSMESPIISWAQVDELRSAIADLRQKGKRVYAYGELMDRNEYLVACACDEIVMTPTGSLWMTGLSLKTVYLRDLLAKLGIQADFLQVGDFKGAAAPFTRTGPSEPEQQQMNHLADGLYNHLLDSIAHSRQINSSQAAALIDQGPFTASQAHQAGLVDRLMYRRDLLKHLETAGQCPVSLQLDYGQPSKPSVNLDNPFAFMSILGGLFGPQVEPKGDAIAIVYINGPIIDGESTEGFEGTTVGSRTMRLALADAKADPDIKAVVIRVDSPGGSANASDIIYQAIQEVAEVKPVVVSMGGMAASGGYYVSAGAPHIFAEPGTITGSIGVVSGKFVFEDLFRKVGITTHDFSRGRHANILSAAQPFSLEERLHQEQQMREVYDIFKQRILTTRQAKLAGPIEELAQGKIYTGLQAKELGLVDDLGGLNDALCWAADRANITEYHIRHLPRPKTIAEVLEELMASGPTNSDPAAARLLSGLGLAPKNTSEFATLLGSPAIRSILRQGLFWQKGLEHEPVFMAMPYVLIIE